MLLDVNIPTIQSICLLEHKIIDFFNEPIKNGFASMDCCRTIQWLIQVLLAVILYVVLNSCKNTHFTGDVASKADCRILLDIYYSFLIIE